jgi:hypothetical protein
MRLTVNDPAAIPSLLAALGESECVADHVDHDALEVLFPWLATNADVQQAMIELAFFVRTWEDANPGVTVGLAAAS